ncbi:hypothetical protein IEO21_02679 [Rhodonia placenta]|uniref:Uncharacterized protein n=1 Tax=Rhodonia placenta TaxID=104341 RepID=A0A8H7P775_9APHY|nr:hypothetical protein IEO21_02679 [Postia placenta]
MSLRRHTFRDVFHITDQAVTLPRPNNAPDVIRPERLASEMRSPWTGAGVSSDQAAPRRPAEASPISPWDPLNIDTVPLPRWAASRMVGLSPRRASSGDNHGPDPICVRTLLGKAPRASHALL